MPEGRLPQGAEGGAMPDGSRMRITVRAHRSVPPQDALPALTKKHLHVSLNHTVRTLKEYVARKLREAAPWRQAAPAGPPLLQWSDIVVRTPAGLLLADDADFSRFQVQAGGAEPVFEYHRTPRPASGPC